MDDYAVYMLYRGYMYIHMRKRYLFEELASAANVPAAYHTDSHETWSGYACGKTGFPT